MSRYERLITQWFTERARPGETFVGWGVLAEPPGNPHFSSGDAMARSPHLDALGLDPDRRILAGHTNLFGAESTHRLVLGSQGGIRFKPKAELASLERSRFQLLWWDRSELGPDTRHVIIRVADGTWWDTSTLVHESFNADGFIRALGDNAVRVEP